MNQIADTFHTVTSITEPLLHISYKKTIFFYEFRKYKDWSIYSMNM